MSAEHGAKATRDRVAALLRADLPARARVMCELWSLPEASIPTPSAKMVTSGEPADFMLDARDRTWIEIVTPRLLPRTEMVGLVFETGNTLFRFTYSARIYCWVIDDHWQTALDMRDRLAVAVRDCLLDYPTLAIPPAIGDTGWLVHPKTITEEFGEPFRIPKSPRVRAGALLAYEVIEEYEVGAPSTRPVPGPYTGFDLAVTLLGWDHPAVAPQP